jgi:hypothetical protein
MACRHMSGVANIDVEPAVIIDVDECNAGAPHAILFQAGLCCDVFELEVAFVQIEFVIAHIGSEQYVGESIIIEIADGYAAAVVKVAEKKTIFRLVVDDAIVKIDAGVFHQVEELGGVFAAAGQTVEGYDKKSVSENCFHFVMVRPVKCIDIKAEGHFVNGLLRIYDLLLFYIC